MRREPRPAPPPARPSPRHRPHPNRHCAACATRPDQLIDSDGQTVTPPRTPPGRWPVARATPRSRQGGRTPARSTGRSSGESRAARPVPRLTDPESLRPVRRARAGSDAEAASGRQDHRQGSSVSPCSRDWWGRTVRADRKGPRWSQWPGRPQRLVPPHRRDADAARRCGLVLSVSPTGPIQGFDAPAVAAEARKQRTPPSPSPPLRGRSCPPDRRTSQGGSPWWPT